MGNREGMKQKLYIVHFKDGYKKPVMAENKKEVESEIEKDSKFSLSDIERIVLEQSYYPIEEDNFPV